MPICIECCYPVSHLYTSYSKADDRALGKGVRLTQCPRCRRFADKYVEHDFVVLFIDLVLIKPQVYRHLLINRLGRDDDKFDRSIIRLGILILLLDVYISWVRIEKSAAIADSKLAHAPIVIQYIFFLTVNALETLAHHLVVRLLALVLVLRPNQNDRDGNNTQRIGKETGLPDPAASVPSLATTTAHSTVSGAPLSRLSRSQSWNSAPGPLGSEQANSSSFASAPPLGRSTTSTSIMQPASPPPSATPTAISTALVVSSCTKLFPILLVIWSPDASGRSRSRDTSSSNPVACSTAFPQESGLLNTLESATSVALATVLPSPQPSISLSSPASWESAPMLQPILSLLLSVTNTHLVLLNNAEALYILLDCGYVRAALITLAGQLVRWTVKKSLLHLVNL